MTSLQGCIQELWQADLQLRAPQLAQEHVLAQDPSQVSYLLLRSNDLISSYVWQRAGLGLGWLHGRVLLPDMVASNWVCVQLDFLKWD